MDLRTGLRLVRERWLSISLVTLLTMVAAATATWLQTPLYSARATLYVSAWSTSTDASAAYTGSLASRERAKSYALLVRSDAVMAAVAEQLNLDTKPTGKIVSEVIPESSLLTVTATDASPAMAQNLANAAAEQFSKIIPQMEASPDGRSPAVRVSVATPAGLPSAPVSPQPMRNAALALLVGLLGGVGLAAVRQALDTTVKSVEQLNNTADVPSLGTVAIDPAAAQSPLISGDDAFSARAEAFRKIRTSLQFLDVDRAHKVVLVTSAVASEGKTSTACNLAITLAEAGKRVLLIDADLRRPRTARYFGLPNGVGLTSVLVGAAGLDDAIQPWSDNLSLLASGPIPPNPSELLGSLHMRELLQHLRGEYDMVILDGPPALPVADAAATATAVDGVVLVVKYGRTRREQVEGVLVTLSTVDARILGTVLNMVPQRAEKYYYEEYGPRPSRSDANTGTANRRGRQLVDAAGRRSRA